MSHQENRAGKENIKTREIYQFTIFYVKQERFQQSGSIPRILHGIELSREKPRSILVYIFQGYYFYGRTMNTREELPPQANELMLELKGKTELNPLSGIYVLVGQNGFLERFANSHKDSFIGSGLINSRKVSSVLKLIGSPCIFHDIGRPELWRRPSCESGYEVERRLETAVGEIEAFVVEREDPTRFIEFTPRQDFVMFYTLFDRMEGSNRMYDDHLRGVYDVVKFETSEMLSKIRIMKDYLLDYLFVRKKALLIGYYFGIVTPAQRSIPDGFRKRIKFDINHGKASVLLAKRNILGDKLIAQLDMFKVILPPNQKILGDFGTTADAPKTTLNTSEGPVQMTKAIGFGHSSSDFLSVAYFDPRVLKKYEDDRRYRIDDNGGVHYAGVWGIFRGIQRLGDDFIAANVGYLSEGLPYQEWLHWAQNNVDPPSIEEIRELQKTKPIQQLVNFLVSEVESFEKRQLLFMAKRDVNVNEPLFEFQSREQKDEIIRGLKKVFTRRTTRSEFLSRVVDLYKLLIDNVNRRLLVSVVDSYDPTAKFDKQKRLKGSLKLLLICLEFRTIERMCKWSGLPEEEIESKVVEYYSNLQQSNTQAATDFLFNELYGRVNSLREAFGALFVLHALRTKAGGAHLGTGREFAKAMNALGFPEDPADLLQVYRTLIDRLIQFFSEA